MLTHKQTIKLNHAIADKLLDRLGFVPFQPDNILELGRVDEYLSDKLSIYYPNAELYGLSENIKKIKSINKNNIFFANLNKLPLPDNSVDLIISNLAIDCLNPNVEELFKELHRIIRLDGLLLFTMLNKNFDTDKINNKDNEELLYIGDLLLINKFCDPVVDQELININYKSNNSDNKILTVEILYGHALGSNAIQTLVMIEE